MSKQLDLDLQDVVQFVEQYQSEMGSGQSLHVRSEYYGQQRWWLMIREHSMAETNYGFVRWLTEDEARELVRVGLADEWFTNKVNLSE